MRWWIIHDSTQRYKKEGRYGGDCLLLLLGNQLVWPVCFHKLDNVGKTVFAGFGMVLFIELTQLLCPERHTDVDDMILNMVGVLIGACVVFAIRNSRKGVT